MWYTAGMKPITMNTAISPDGLRRFMRRRGVPSAFDSDAPNPLTCTRCRWANRAIPRGTYWTVAAPYDCPRCGHATLVTVGMEVE
jgi:hypothetical protein